MVYGLWSGIWIFGFIALGRASLAIKFKPWNVNPIHQWKVWRFQLRASGPSVPGLKYAQNKTPKNSTRQEGGVPPQRIILGGFGAGATVALYTALVCETRLGGVVGCAASLPRWITSPGRTAGGKGFDCSAASAHLPVMICHGNSDKVWL
jgi:hypothetical protein